MTCDGWGLKSRGVRWLNRPEESPLRKLAYIIVAVLLINCGGGGGGGGGDGSVAPSPPSVDITGSWKGNYTSNVSSLMNVDISVQQDGSSFTGSFRGFQLTRDVFGNESYSFTSGNISGNVSGYTANFDITVTTSGCGGSLSGTGIVDDSTVGAGELTRMSISFSGSTTCGGAENGKGELWRNPGDTTGIYSLLDYTECYSDQPDSCVRYIPPKVTHTGMMVIDNNSIYQEILLSGNNIEVIGVGNAGWSNPTYTYTRVSDGVIIKSLQDGTGWSGWDVTTGDFFTGARFEDPVTGVTLTIFTYWDIQNE